MTGRLLLLPLALFAGAVGLAGCGKDKPADLQRVRVSGKVLLDSKPLKTGKITFDPQNGEPPASLDILDGMYEGKAPVGKNKVTLTSEETVSMKEKMKMDGPGYDTPVKINLLPDRYNNKSQISREVEAGGDNTFNFELSSN